MSIGGISGGGASQAAVMVQLNRQLNEQAVQRNAQTMEKMKGAVTAVINGNIASQQRSIAIGESNLRMGSVINTTA